MPPRCARSSRATRSGSSARGEDRVVELAALLGPSDIRALAGRLGIVPSKRLGQNFVVDGGTVARVAAAARLTTADVVLEVGPGFGSLTLPLLGAAGHVVAVEIDAALAAELPATVAAPGPGPARRAGGGTAD